MTNLSPSALKLAVILGSCLIFSLGMVVFSLYRLRQRWREGQETLRSLRDEARSMNVQMQGNVQTPTSDAEN